MDIGEESMMGLANDAQMRSNTGVYNKTVELNRRRLCTNMYKYVLQMGQTQPSRHQRGSHRRTPAVVKAKVCEKERISCLEINTSSLEGMPLCGFLEAAINRDDAILFDERHVFIAKCLDSFKRRIGRLCSKSLQQA